MDGAQSGASGPLSPPPARAAVVVTAVTSRDDFLLEIGAALDGQASVTPVESAALALASLSDAKRPQILAIDARDLVDVRADADAVLARAPHVSVLVFVAEGTEREAAAAFKGSGIFALLTLPIDERKTAAVFGGAVAECVAKLNADQSAATPSRPGTAFSPPSAHDTTAPESVAPSNPAENDDGAGRNMRPLLGGGVALAIIAAGAIWFFVKDEPPAPPIDANGTAVAPTPAPGDVPAPAAEIPLAQGKVDDLLEKARLAMRERRYAEPKGDNALHYYRSVLAAEAGNGEAGDGLARVTSVLAGRFDDALAANRHDEAASTLSQLESATRDDAYVSGFQLRLTTAQISKALAEDDPDRAAALLRAAQNGNAIPAVQQTKWNAEITRLRDQSRQKSEAEKLARDAAAAEQKKVRDARAAAAAAAEQQAEVASEQKALQEEMKAEQAAKAAQEAASATEAKTQADLRVLRSQLKHKRYVAPDYPEEALKRSIGGVVTVAFTVDTEGATRDVRVESSDPPQVFDRAATTAVKRWRYEPPLLDGVPAEVPVSLAIRFKIPE